MNKEQPNNPLHGITLKVILQELVDRHGWDYLAEETRIRSLGHQPSFNGALRFLRKTPWARAKFEALYLRDLGRKSAQ